VKDGTDEEEVIQIFGGSPQLLQLLIPRDPPAKFRTFLKGQ